MQAEESSLRNHVLVLPEETTSEPYVGPWYEEYDYADCTSPPDRSSCQMSMCHHVQQGPLDRDRRLLFFFLLFAVAAKKQEEEEERARKEKAEKGLLFKKKNFQRNVERLPKIKTTVVQNPGNITDTLHHFMLLLFETAECKSPLMCYSDFVTKLSI